MSKFFIVMILSILGTDALAAGCRHTSGDYFKIIGNPQMQKSGYKKIQLNMLNLTQSMDL
jgi:hypothetical protein